jgi:integrase
MEVSNWTPPTFPFGTFGKASATPTAHLPSRRRRSSRRALAVLPDNLLGCRDRALLLVGFAAALRRSELASLEVAPRDGVPGWIEESAEGLTIYIARSKTDQTGEGDAIGIPYGSSSETCPVRAYKNWIQRSGIMAGSAFRPITRHGRIGNKAMTDKTVARVVKRAIIRAALGDGLAPQEATALAAKFGGHSLRAGLATSAAMNDAPCHAIQRQLRHTRFDTTTRYIGQDSCSSKTQPEWRHDKMALGIQRVYVDCFRSALAHRAHSSLRICAQRRKPSPAAVARVLQRA